jgi:hypothetical protein
MFGRSARKIELLMSMIVPKLAMIFRHRVTLNELAIQVCFYIQD